MKKIVSLLLGLLMVVMATTAMAETVTVQPGDELELKVSITAGGMSAKIGIKTNSAPVTFVSAVGGEVNDTVPPKAFDDFFVVVNAEGLTLKPDGSGYENIGDYNMVNLVEGVIGTLTFKVNDDAAAGTYTVEAYKKAGSCTVEGSITFVVEAASSGRIPGDVNDDGEVDMIDSVLLDRYLADWDVTINMSNADVNGDGEVDMIDSVLLDRYLADWDVELI